MASDRHPRKRSPKAAPSRLRAEKLGHRAELIAAWFLRLKGYRILEQRFRTKLGEIDIIAKKGDLVAMVEVKARRSVEDAVNAVGQSSRQRIENAGDIWVARQRDGGRYSVRYDIIAVIPRKLPCHLPGAW